MDRGEGQRCVEKVRMDAMNVIEHFYEKVIALAFFRVKVCFEKSKY